MNGSSRAFDLEEQLCWSEGAVLELDPWMNSDVLQRFDDERRTKNDERLMNFKGLLGLILEEWMYGFQGPSGLDLGRWMNVASRAVGAWSWRTDERMNDEWIFKGFWACSWRWMNVSSRCAGAWSRRTMNEERRTKNELQRILFQLGSRECICELVNWNEWNWLLFIEFSKA